MTTEADIFVLENSWELTGLPAKRELFLGIDPGQSGGFAILESAGVVIDVTPMPDTEADIAAYLREFGMSIRMAYIEAVHSMPKQGIASAFKFGCGYGGLRMALVCLRIPFESVTPGSWQKRLGAIVHGRTLNSSKTAKKNGTKARAQELFPGRKITHATADALLIAEDCRRCVLHGKAAV